MGQKKSNLSLSVIAVLHTVIGVDLSDGLDTLLELL